MEKKLFIDIKREGGGSNVYICIYEGLGGMTSCQEQPCLLYDTLPGLSIMVNH